jgi:4-hydroxybenzoate polyprenyltransferase
VTAAPVSSALRSFRIIAGDIKIAHSVFAMPFALLAAFMAALSMAPDARALRATRFAGQIALIIGAMILARTVAMLANRLIDRHLDVDNPRTAGRAIPSGRLSPRAALGVLAACAAGFLAVCAAFGAFYGNWWPPILALPVLAWISAYAFLKRFTMLCHLYLGSSLALSPLAAAIAIEPSSLSSQPALWLLSAMVLCWVAGFDIIYALQDLDVDAQQGLHSMPSRLGPRRALWISRLLHAIAAGCLIAALLVDPRFGLLFGIGTAIVIALLSYEHATVSKWGTTRIALAFFTLNGSRHEKEKGRDVKSRPEANQRLPRAITGDDDARRGRRGRAVRTHRARGPAGSCMA